MLGSTNTFFNAHSKEELKKLKIEMRELLSIKGRGDVEIREYEIAFDFFDEYPWKYDGATIVKDLVDIRTDKGYLDVDAMLHDYQYVNGANKSFKLKWRADLKYIKNMEKNGKGTRVFRMILLTLIGIVFVPYMKHLK
jgi:hypothetical protein